MLFIRLIPHSVVIKFLITFFILCSSIIAGNTGKIFGKVTDEKTNEPLTGVNVVIKNNGQGASTDIAETDTISNELDFRFPCMEIDLLSCLY